MAHVLPTGRNFYSVDPRAVPSPLAWEVGRLWPNGWSSATSPRRAGRRDRWAWSSGVPQRCAPAATTWLKLLALLGVRPRWAEANGRVEGLELIALEELGRPRVDVTLRVSGFFRDAFPHVLDLLDEAVALAAA